MTRAAAYFITMFTLVGDRLEGRKDRGATAVEYGLMVGLIAVAIIIMVTLLGTELRDLFQSVANAIPGVPAAG